MYSQAGPGPQRRGNTSQQGAPANVQHQQPMRGGPAQSSQMGAPQMGPTSSSSGNRVGELFDQIKAEYEGAVQQLNMAKMEQMEMERKFQSQVVEMDQIQQTLKTLETNHRRMRQQYEEDVMRLRRQLEGQAASTSAPMAQTTSTKSSNKRHRPSSSTNSPPGSSAGMQEDSMMSVMANAATNSSRAGQRASSPAHMVPVQPASRSLRQLQAGEPSTSQAPTGPPPQLSPLENPPSGPADRRGAQIPQLNRESLQDHGNGAKVENRPMPPVSTIGQEPSSPASNKNKSNGNDNNAGSIPSLTNGKGTLPSVSAPGQVSGSTLMRPMSKIHHTSSNSGENSPEPKEDSDHGGSNNNKESGLTASQNSNMSHKASKLNWNCLYSNPRSGYQDTERPQAELYRSMDHQSVVCCVRFSAEGSMLASGCHKTVHVFDVKSGQQKLMVSRPGAGSGESASVPTNDNDDAYVRAVCFSPDSTKVVAGMPQSTIRMWDIATQEELTPLMGHEAEIYSLAYVNDLIVSGSGDRRVRLWDARTSECKAVFGAEDGGPQDGVTSVALSPDGRLLAAASLDKIVRVWDTETSQLVERLEGHSDSVYSCAFSPDGKNVISGSLDRNIMLWDVSGQGRSANKPRMLFQGHKDFVLSVAYTPDGRWLMSGSKDRSVVFWDPRSSRSVLTLTGYRNSVISVASSPASPYFATGSGDSFAVVWKYQCQSL